MKIKSHKYLLLLFFITLLSCQKDDLIEMSLDFAKDNKEQLMTVLNHYADSPKKLNSAKQLIRNMPHWYAYKETPELDSIENMLHIISLNKDIWYFAGLSSRNWKSYDYHNIPKIYDSHVIKAHYLINSIDQAYKLREKYNWNHGISDEIFDHYLLPYRIGDERLSNWRNLYGSHYSIAIDSICPETDDSLIAAEAVWSVLEKEGFKYNVCSSWPHRVATDIFYSHAGPCRDQTDHYLYALRAVGIPCAIDTYFNSPELATSHRWVVVFDNKTGRFIPLGKNMIDKRNKNINDGSKKGKVYRLMPFLQQDRVELIKQTLRVEAPVRDYYLKDVSQEYFGSNSLTVNIDNPENKTVMLGVFTPGGWQVVDYTTEHTHKKATFNNVEPNALYIPLIEDGQSGNHKPCGMPLLFKADLSIEIFSPEEERETITLTRKMPFTSWLYYWFSSGVAGGKFDLADNINFKNAISTQNLPDTLPSNRFSLLVPPTHTKYIRYSVPENNEVVIGEIEVYSDSAGNTKIPYRVVTAFDRYHDSGKIHDNDILTFFALPEPMRSITLELETPQKVESIVFIPRNNDNFVWKGDRYKLMYFDSIEKGWVECDSAEASDWELVMEAPKGALLWLRDISKGHEEQPFIWRDTRQVFVYDIGRS